MIRCMHIILTPEAMQFAKSNRKSRTGFSKNKPLYCIHYTGSEFGSICVDLETLEHVARLSVFPSRKLKENFINGFIGSITFPYESKVKYEWLYRPAYTDFIEWKYND